MKRDRIEKNFGAEWVDFIAPFMDSADGVAVEKELGALIKDGTAFAPAIPDVFKAFRELPLSKVKVIILGQDPYPVAGYSNGYAFGHPKELKPSSSMNVIIDTVEQDAYGGLNFDKPNFDTTLEHWVEQGVLLLNTALTVPIGNPATVASAHATLWEGFTKHVINTMCQVKRNMIYLAWGSKATDFTKDINPFTEFLFTTEHPTLAAREKRPWKCNHFSLVNTVITANRLGDKIRW